MNYGTNNHSFISKICECLESCHEQINAKIQFLSFSQIFRASKITGYAVPYYTAEY